MADLYNYGTTEPIPFKVTKNGAGVDSITFSSWDVQLSLQGSAFLDISGQCDEMIGTGQGEGWYVWTPSIAAYTSVPYFIIHIKEQAGTNFDENGLVFYTGGNASARFSG